MWETPSGGSADTRRHEGKGFCFLPACFWVLLASSSTLSPPRSFIDIDFFSPALLEILTAFNTRLGQPSHPVSDQTAVEFSLSLFSVKAAIVGLPKPYGLSQMYNPFLFTCSY